MHTRANMHVHTIDVRGGALWPCNDATKVKTGRRRQCDAHGPVVQSRHEVDAAVVRNRGLVVNAVPRRTRAILEALPHEVARLSRPWRRRSWRRRRTAYLAQIQ